MKKIGKKKIVCPTFEKPQKINPAPPGPERRRGVLASLGNRGGAQRPPPLGDRLLSWGEHRYLGYFLENITYLGYFLQNDMQTFYHFKGDQIQFLVPKNAQ